jgi:hypothetical protein
MTLIELQGGGKQFSFTEEVLKELYGEFDDLQRKGANRAQIVLVVAKRHDYGLAQTYAAYSKWEQRNTK